MSQLLIFVALWCGHINPRPIFTVDIDRCRTTLINCINPLPLTGNYKSLEGETRMVDCAMKQKLQEK